MVLGLYTLRTTARSGTFNLWSGDRPLVDVAEVVKRQTDAQSVVFAIHHSGSLRYYGGRMTLRFDGLDGDWLDRAVTWLLSRGVHPYALLEPWEVAQFEARFRGQRVATDLPRSAVLVYHAGRSIVLYDLARTSEVAPRDVSARDPRDLRAVAPAPAPTLIFRRP